MVATKIKPQRIDANNSPQVGYVPKYVDEQTFEWGAGSGATDIGNNYLILTGTMAGTPPEVDIADTRITDATPYLVFYETQPVGNITRTLTNGNLNISSDDDDDAGLDVKVLFWNIGPARNYMKGNTTLTGAGPRTVTDPRITATTPAMIMPRTTPVGYVTATTGAGVMTIASTGTEVGVIVDYIITLDTTNYSDGMPYNATLDDDDMFFRKGQSGDDEAVKWSDMKGGISGAGARVMMFISKQFAEATTTTSYTHNLGRVPEYIKMEGVNNTAYGYSSFGSWIKGGTQMCVYTGNLPSASSNDGSAIAVLSYDSGIKNRGVISNITSTGFDITRTFSGGSSALFGLNFLVTLQ